VKRGAAIVAASLGRNVAPRAHRVRAVRLPDETAFVAPKYAAGELYPRQGSSPVCLLKQLCGDLHQPTGQ
jgi:hypothetical protein